MSKVKYSAILIPTVGLLALPLTYLMVMKGMHEPGGPDDGVRMLSFLVTVCIACVFTFPSLVIGLICLLCESDTEQGTPRERTQQRKHTAT